MITMMQNHPNKMTKSSSFLGVQTHSLACDVLVSVSIPHFRHTYWQQQQRGVAVTNRISLGGTVRWLQLQPSSAWPRPTVRAFQYFRWCALTKPAVSHFLRRIYNLSKEEAL